MNEDLRGLVQQLVALQSQAQQLGLFANDRELLTCPNCGLMENVASGGRLFTCRSDALEIDTGLRFEETTRGSFRCPVCGAAACEDAQL